MSAQAGIWNFNDKPVDQTLAERLSTAIAYYGPDRASRHMENSIGMVYRAFQTTPESHTERQPYVSGHGNVITWDGRIDNRSELISLLGTEMVGDRTDVAIVAAAFDRWGSGCFRRIIGDWAISIWRPTERELLFACDFMAIRHIFYHLRKECVYWSTDLASLVPLSGHKFHIDDDFIAGYLAYEPDCHLTPYREIRQVPAGQFVCVQNNGNISMERYWQFSPESRIRYKSDEEYEDHFRHVFRQAVRRRLRSDSPILAELSGGLDSSSIVCMADDILAKEGAQTPRIDTLSCYDNTEPSGDDWVYFQKIEGKRGRPGVHIDASKMESSGAPLQPAEFSSLPGYLGFGRELEAKRAATVQGGGYRVVLSGIGGDEFTGGVPNPIPLLADLIVQCKYVSLAKELMAWSLVKRRPWIQLFGQAFLDLVPTSVRQYVASQAKLEPWIEKRFAKKTNLVWQLLDVKEHFGLWLPARRSLIAGVVMMANKMAKYALPSQALEEISYPFLDQDLIEFVLAIPTTQLLRPGERRSLMRRSLAGIVPHEILSRRTKQFGARTPLRILQLHSRNLQEIFRTSLSSRFGFINGDRFCLALENVMRGKDVPMLRLLKIVSLEFWLRDLASRRLIETDLMPSQPVLREMAVQTNA